MKMLLEDKKVKAFIDASGDIWIVYNWSDGQESVCLSKEQLKRAYLAMVNEQ